MTLWITLFDKKFGQGTFCEIEMDICVWLLELVEEDPDKKLKFE